MTCQELLLMMRDWNVFFILILVLLIRVSPLLVSPRHVFAGVFISRLLSTRYLFHAHRVVYHWLKAVLMQLLKKGTSVTFSLSQIFSTFSI